MARIENGVPTVMPSKAVEETWSRAEFAQGVRQAGTDLVKTVMLARVVSAAVTRRRR